MGIKELAIPALATAGGLGTGAGGAYVAGNYFSDGRDGGVSSSEQADLAPTIKEQSSIITPKKSDLFTTSTCFSKFLNKEGDSAWLMDLANESASHEVSIGQIEPKHGCLIVTAPKDGPNVKSINVEMVIMDGEDEAKSSNGVVIWSSLSKGDSDAFALVSRVLYLSRNNVNADNKWKAKQGLEFTSSLDGTKDKVSGFGRTEGIPIGNMCKDNEDCLTQGSLKDIVNKEYKWTDTDPKDKTVFDYVKITKADNKNVLFFGRDLSTSDDVKDSVSAVYIDGKGWKKIEPADKSPKQTLLKTVVQGQWSLVS